MFFDRSEDIKKLMPAHAEDAKEVGFNFQAETPICKQCANFLQGEIMKKHLD
jgi:hypothetical protein